MRLITYPIMLALGLAQITGAETVSDLSAADRCLTDARDVLAAGQKSLPGPERERITRMIAVIDAALSKGSTRQESDTASAEKLDPKDLKRIIHGRHTIKGDKNDEITIVYTWKPDDLADWIVSGPTPEFSRGSIIIPPGGSLTHKARFATKVGMQGDIALKNKNGEHIGSTSGLQITVTNYNAWSVNLSRNKSPIGSAMYDKDYTITDASKEFIPFLLSLDKGVVSLSWKNHNLGGSYAGDFGSPIISGGTGGNIFKTLTMTGVVDRDWVKQALQQADIDAVTATGGRKHGQ